MRLLVICLLVVLATTNLVKLSQQACTPLPLGKSQIKSCNYDGTVCTYDVTSSFLFNVAEADTVCLKLTDRDGDHVNITINKLAVDYTAEYCYFTDDPIPQFKPKCGCPLSATSHIDEKCTEAANIQGVDNNFSTFHKMMTKGCLIEKIGNVCAKHAFEAMKRFKVCKINKSWQYDAIATASYKGMFAFGHNEANNMITIGINGTQIQIIINLSQVLPTQIADFVLVDLHRQKDFYLLPSSLVNDLNTYDINKIGWLKVKSFAQPKPGCVSTRGSCGLQILLPPQSILQTLVTPTMIDCVKDKVLMSYSIQSMLAHTLEDNPQYRASSISPSSVYIDGDLHDGLIMASKERFDHTMESPEHILDWGYMGVNIDGQPVVVGITRDGLIQGEAGEDTGKNISKVCSCLPGQQRTSEYYIHYIIREKPTPGTLAITTHIWRDRHKPECYSIQRNVDQTYGFSINVFANQNTDKWNAYVWPDMRVHKITATPQHVTVTPLDQAIALPTVVVKPNLGAITLLVKGSIDVVTQINDNAKVSLVSCNSTHCDYSNEGNAQSCFFDTKPQVFTSTQISFRPGLGSFELHPMNNFTGSTVLTVSCGKYSSSKSLSYNFTLDIKTRKALDHEPASNDVAHEAKQVLGGIWNSITDFFDFSKATFSTYLILGLIIFGLITVLIVSIALFILLYPYIAPLLGCCCNFLSCCCKMKID